MYYTGTDVGALTNFQTWIVLERDDDDVISVTRVDGVTADGRSNALNIMLKMSLGL